MIENLNREIELVKIAKAIERSEIDQLWSSLNPSDYDNKSLMSPVKNYLSATPGQSVTGKMTPAKRHRPKVNRQTSAVAAGMPSSSQRENIHQSYSQLSELDDNISAVILNYDNLHGLIESSGHQPRLRMPQAANGEGQSGVRASDFAALNLQSEQNHSRRGQNG